MKMQQLISMLNITGADCTDTIHLMKMEASTILRSIEREQLTPSFTVVKLKRGWYKIRAFTADILRKGDRVIYGLDNNGQYIIVDEINFSDDMTVELVGTSGEPLKCKIEG